MKSSTPQNSNDWLIILRRGVSDQKRSVLALGIPWLIVAVVLLSGAVPEAHLYAILRDMLLLNTAFLLFQAGSLIHSRIMARAGEDLMIEVDLIHQEMLLPEEFAAPSSSESPKASTLQETLQRLIDKKTLTKGPTIAKVGADEIPSWIEFRGLRFHYHGISDLSKETTSNQELLVHRYLFKRSEKEIKPVPTPDTATRSE